MPNHSFENHYGVCPPNDMTPFPSDFTTYVEEWHSVFGTTDYFNTCNPDGMYTVGIPVNIHGIQYPRTGNAYVGVGIYNPNCFAGETIEVQLINALQQNKEYYLEFYVSHAEGNTLANHNIGVYFSNVFLFGNIINCSIVPQIENTKQIQPLTDRENWMKVSGTFIAQGGEIYLIIANFRDSNSAELDIVPPSPPYGSNPYNSYYYIDDVFLYDYEEWQAWQDSLNNNIPKPLKLPNAFSPNGDGINDYFVIEGIEQYPNNELYIYNHWGELVYYKQGYKNEFTGYSNNTPSSRREIERTKSLTEGTYFYVFRTGKDNESYSGFIELKR